MSTSRKTHSGGETFAGKAKRVAGGMIGRMSAKTVGSVSSTAFVRNASIGDLYEIEAAKMALRRASSPRVKEIAQRMIDDHTTSTHQLRSALRMKETPGDLKVPEAVDERRKAMLDQLRAARDGEFDKVYLDQQVLAHKETVDLMTGYESRGSNPQLRSLAAGTAPVVKRHLRQMEAMRGELAG